MAATYKWSIKSILAKPIFTDKNGNTRENVIKSVVLRYSGELDGKEAHQDVSVNLSIIDLTNFKDHSTLTEDQVIQWALSKVSDREKLHAEALVKSSFEELSINNNTVEIKLS